jgi:GTP-binding protein EngB required for normal cell division
MKTQVELNGYVNEVKEIAKRNELSTAELEKISERMDNFKVAVPIIGGFSTGKSSLINTLIGEKLLPTQITAETALPAEIYAGDNKVVAYKNETKNEFALNEFDFHNAAENGYTLIEAELDNEFLKTVPDVKIVDMPGLDSTNDNHSKAITDYLPQSLAYIIAIPANNPVIKQSVAEFLRTLKLCETPTYFILTKCDKVTEDGLKESVSYYKKQVSEILDLHDVKIYCTRARGSLKDAGGLAEILTSVQEKAENIFTVAFKKEIAGSATAVREQLSVLLNNLEVSDSDIDERIESLNKSLEETNKNNSGAKSSFIADVERAANKVEGRISSELSSSKQILFNDMKGGHDITSKVRSIIERCVTEVVNTELERAYSKYIRDIDRNIEINFAPTYNYDNTDAANTINGLKTAINTAATLAGGTLGTILGSTAGSLSIPAASMALTAAGTAGGTGLGSMLGSWAGPVGAIIGAGIGFLASKLISNASRSKQEREAMSQLEAYLEELSKSVSASVREQCR